MTFAERDHVAETLFLDGAHEALRVRVRTGCLIRRLHHADAGLAQSRAYERDVAITDQHALPMRTPSSAAVSVRPL